MEQQEKFRFKKIGGGSLRFNGRRIRPREIFEATLDEIPKAFKDSIKRLPPLNGTPPVRSIEKSEGTPPVYQMVKNKELSTKKEDLFDIVDLTTKKLISEKGQPLPEQIAKETLTALRKAFNIDNAKEIEKMYQLYCTESLKYRSGDIQEHLPTLREYARKVEHVTEMGVRDGASTIAIGAASPKTMVSYDIIQQARMQKVVSLLEESKIDFKFILGDVLKLKIDKTDMLFIDTLHTYNQLITELRLHQSRVKKYIILHDTVSFGFKDEKIYSHASGVVKQMKKEKEGLITAIDDFLKRNKKWVIEAQFKNNNGLTVLRRVK